MASGRAYELPITFERGEIIDPVPTKGGLINGNTKIGFDSQDRVIISYHKFDDGGDTQVYNARFEGDGWQRYQTSDWAYRWAFEGGGTIPFEIQVGPVEHDPQGGLVQRYDHVKYGSGKWLLDEETLQPIEEVSPVYRYPPELERIRSDDPDMQVNWAHDRGTAPDDFQYALHWETLAPNRDGARDEPPPPTVLSIHKFARAAPAELD